MKYLYPLILALLVAILTGGCQQQNNHPALGLLVASLRFKKCLD